MQKKSGLANSINNLKLNNLKRIKREPAKLWRAIAALSFAGLSALSTVSANASEIIFFEFPGFSGQQLTMRATTANFDTIGFNDRTASVVVRSGTWLVCTDADFKGTCATFVRGEYANLDTRFAGRISSARDVETYGAQTGNAGNSGNAGNDYITASRPSIELFEQRDYSGQSIKYDVDTANFSASSFNDRASSLIVRNGTWELCTDAEYRGSCRRYTPGRYSDLGYGMARQVSSARLIQSELDLPYVIGSGTGDTSGGVGKLVLFEGDNLLGRSLGVADNMLNLERAGFNDLTRSMVIERGSWEFCTDADFRGLCRVFGPGQYRRVDADLYRAISSIRAVAGTNAGAPASMGGRPGVGTTNRGRGSNDGAEIMLYEQNKFMGRTFTTRTNVEDLASKDFNDRAMSVVVTQGRWQLCTDASYSGRCVVYGPGRYENLLGLNNQLSSIRRIHEGR